MSTIWNLLKSKFFWKNIGIAFVVSMLLLLVTILMLNRLTRHGEQIEVPDLIGLNEEEARVFLTQKGIVPDIIDSVQIRDYKPGEIVEQNPAPHTFVKKNRHIYLTVNARQKRMLPVPDLKDVSFRQAKAMLESVGFEVSGVVYVPSEFPGLVQNVRYENVIVDAGTRLPDGAKVELVVGQSDDSNDVVEVPSFLTLSYDEAQRALADAGFVLGAVVNDETILSDAEQQEAFVWKQIPQSNEWVTRGKRIDLWLTKNPDKFNNPVVQETEEEIFF